MKNTVYEALVAAYSSDNIVDKHIGKPGLDQDSGRFRVAGTLTLGKVFKRKNIGTNLALSSGYLIEDCESGDKLFVEKQQGVKLCATYGMKNAFIYFRSKKRTDDAGELMQSNQSTYLQPFPQSTESFTQDDRIVTAFELDEEGYLIRPFQLNVTKEQCTEELWRIVEVAYAKGSQVSKRARRKREEQHLTKLENIRQALKIHGTAANLGKEE